MRKRLLALYFKIVFLVSFTSEDLLLDHLLLVYPVAPLLLPCFSIAMLKTFGILSNILRLQKVVLKFLQRVELHLVYQLLRFVVDRLEVDLDVHVLSFGPWAPVWLIIV